MSLHGTYDSDNIFGKILRGEMANVTVFEDEDVLAFMDVYPQSRGHTLVIPKQGSRNFLDADPEILSRLITGTQTVAKALEAALKPDGIVITQFNGAAAGQTVFHLHFHIIPRWEDIDMGRHAGGRMADMEELQSLAAKIRKEL